MAAGPRLYECGGAGDLSGSLQKFRERLIAAGLDRRLLERTVEIAKTTKEFDWKKLPKALHIAVDSRPLEGAGRVEDTINLLGHAARKIVTLAAQLTGIPVITIAQQARIPIALYGSTKAALDRDWSDPEQGGQALEELLAQIDSLQAWLARTELENERPLQRYIEAIGQIRAQDAELDDRVALESSKVLRRTGASLSRNRRCVTVARAKVSASTGTSSILPRT